MRVARWTGWGVRGVTRRVRIRSVRADILGYRFGWRAICFMEWGSIELDGRVSVVWRVGVHDQGVRYIKWPDQLMT